MSFKDEAENLIAVILMALILIIGISVYNFIQSKFSRHINPQAIVTIGDIQIETLKYDLNNIDDKKLQKILQSVITISQQEEHLTFETVYKRIKKLNYYDLPPLYWDQLNKTQKKRAFNVWEDYMKSLISQCGGNEFIKFSSDEIEKCVEQKKRQIEERKKTLFD